MKITIIVFSILIFCSSVIAQKQPIVVYLAGDSTCAIKMPDKRPETGWGEMLGKHFDETKIKIDDRALNGRSTSSFIAEGHWQEIIANLKKGDYVFIQFGHNDESKEKVGRYTAPADFHANLVRFVSEVRAKNATPVLLTPVMRRKFDANGNFVDTHGEYPDIVRAVAKEQKVALIDAHRKTEKLLKSLGPENSRTLFLQLKAGENPNYPKGVEDNTHFNPKGADAVAALIVEGIKEEKIGLKKYLKK